jgi:uncharacterized protein (TIGR03435 family)
MLMTFVLVAAALLGSQSVTDKSQRFEVASIKSNKSGDNRQWWQFYEGGRYSATNTPLRWLIRVAYDIPMATSQLVGGPDWLDTERYDVEAKAALGVILPDLPTTLREAKMKVMLQTLLAERFKLVLRREVRERSIYALVAKNGARLQPAKVEEAACSTVTSPPAPCHRFAGGPERGLKGDAVSMADLTKVLSAFVDRPVVDKTGLNGLFDLKLAAWTPAQPVVTNTESSANDRLTIFSVLDELGLKLDAQKDSVDAFVIAQAEKPTPN